MEHNRTPLSTQANIFSFWTIEDGGKGNKKVAKSNGPNFVDISFYPSNVQPIQSLNLISLLVPVICLRQLSIANRQINDSSRVKSESNLVISLVHSK